MWMCEFSPAEVSQGFGERCQLAALSGTYKVRFCISSCWECEINNDGGKRLLTGHCFCAFVNSLVGCSGSPPSCNHCITITLWLVVMQWRNLLTDYHIWSVHHQVAMQQWASVSKRCLSAGQFCNTMILPGLGPNMNL